MGVWLSFKSFYGSNSNHCFFNFSIFSNADESYVSWVIEGGEEKEGGKTPAVLVLEAVRPPLGSENAL